MFEDMVVKLKEVFKEQFAEQKEFRDGELRLLTEIRDLLQKLTRTEK